LLKWKKALDQLRLQTIIPTRKEDWRNVGRKRVVVVVAAVEEAREKKINSSAAKNFLFPSNTIQSMAIIRCTHFLQFETASSNESASMYMNILG
jgi:hypothetical protein